MLQRIFSAQRLKARASSAYAILKKWVGRPLSFIWTHHATILGFLTLAAASLACYFTYNSVQLMRESARQTQEQLKLAEEQFDLVKESLATARTQLESLQAYQADVLATPDFSIKLEVPFEEGVEIRRGWHPTVREVYVRYEGTFISILTVQNVGTAPAKNFIVSVSGSNHAVYELPANPNTRLPDFLQWRELFRDRQSLLLPKESYMRQIPVTIIEGAIDGTPQLSVSVHADNMIQRYQRGFVFRKKKETDSKTPQ
ncbi:hypothetical protein MYX77_06890 [Acidobacteriia bacterium AH_259_A11_L15]|nr:hypothetical protein [Acidobacteriia bacterium AH_259_A11_L15]